MDQQLIEKVMKQVSDELGIKQEECRAEATKEECCGSNIGLTEFVGTAIGDTIGLVIASVDPLLVDVMKLGKYRSIGIVGGRVGAGPQIWAVDEAVKATNTEIISVELPRDTKGGAGHGSLIYIGADDVSDARRAVEIALQVLPKYFGDVYVPVYRKSQLLSGKGAGRTGWKGIRHDMCRAGCNRYSSGGYCSEGS